MEHEQVKPNTGVSVAEKGADGEQPVQPPGEGASSDAAAFNPEAADRDALLVRCRALEERAERAEDRALRVAADADNFKKRMERDKQESIRYGNERFIAELLPVIDSLERALEHAPGDSRQDGLIQGVEMTLKRFQDTLAKFGCTAIEASGKLFDPKYHEAVYREETEEHPNNTIVRELQKGYVLNDRLLRPAMVVVASSPRIDADNKNGNTSTGEKNSANSHVRIKVTSG
ncbi:MAG TPA: nucleotide exchange factor GrpE [Syntrophobacteria bacterium]|nr:nucleotide exchange factor GrpE [Syntrophobacteria bacterium]